jgi:hypothetical protein
VPLDATKRLLHKHAPLLSDFSEHLTTGFGDRVWKAHRELQASGWETDDEGDVEEDEEW